MTKLLFLLSVIVMLGALVMSYLNKQAFADLRQERNEANHKVKANLKDLDTRVKEVKEDNVALASATTEAQTAKERVNQVEIKINNTAKDKASISKEIDDINAHRTELTSKFKGLPDGVTPENLTEKAAQMKTALAETKKKVEDGEAAAKAKVDELKKTEDQREDIVKRIDTRKKEFARNSLSCRVVAVNNDWGFLVIDAGERQGISSETKLLVTRGQDTIAKLNIISVEPGKTLANIDQKSTRKGISVAPGDQVILETLIQ